MEKTHLHLDPLEPYEGMDKDLPLGKWRADRPLDFAAGFGFFETVHRLEGHVRGLSNEIHDAALLFDGKRLIGEGDDPDLAAHLRLARLYALPQGEGLRLAPEHPLTPEALVVTAVVVLRAALHLVARDMAPAAQDTDAEHPEPSSVLQEPDIPFLRTL